MHGDLSVGDDVRGYVEDMDDLLGFRLRLQKASKYLRIFLQYLEAMQHESYAELIKPSNYGHFVQLMISPGAAYAKPWLHKDVCADHALVYSEAHRRMFIEIYGYSPERFIAVGSPYLDPVFELLRNPAVDAESRRYIERLGAPAGKPAVAYLEDSFAAYSDGVSRGLYGWTTHTLIEELRSVAEATKEAGMHLLVKLHPATAPDPIC